MTNRSGLGTCSGFRRVMLTIEKIAVVAPVPSASVISTVIVKAGLLKSARLEYFRSVIHAPTERFLTRNRFLPDSIIHKRRFQFRSFGSIHIDGRGHFRSA